MSLMQTAFRIVRTLVALPVGYVVLVIASTFVQETMFGGVSFHKSPLSTLILAGILTPFSGVVAGLATAAIAGRAWVLHSIPLCIWIGIETTILYTRHIVDGPLWFEGGAGLALAGGVAAGAWFWGWGMKRFQAARSVSAAVQGR